VAACSPTAGITSGIEIAVTEAMVPGPPATVQTNRSTGRPPQNTLQSFMNGGICSSCQRFAILAQRAHR
jgi:hypothetical protein